jgi:hypothetical protein
MKIKTPSNELNRVLGGGIPVNEITMFYGEPGVGKTRMMLEFAYHVVDMGYSISMSTSGGDQVKKFFNSYHGKKILASMAKNKRTPDVFFVDDYRTASRRTLLALEEKRTTVVAFGPMPRRVFSYNCAVIVRILNQKGIMDLFVEKNRYGTTESFVRYRSFGLNEKGGDVDRSGETYNPYTGKWSFL